MSRLGFALAMRVLQSDLYQQLDEVERAECDELIDAGKQRPCPANSGGSICPVCIYGPCTMGGTK